MEGLLKYGAIGLALALSILVYQLVRVNSKKEKISRDNYYLLFSFMAFAVIVMFVGIYAESIKTDIKAKVSRIKNNPKYTWQTYNRTGCSIALPDIFKESDITDQTQCYQTNISDEIKLKVDCKFCSQYTNYSRFQQLYNLTLNECSGITYRFFKNNIFVVSGIKSGGATYYYKGILKNNSFYYLSVDYPAAYQYLFDEIMTGISRSFK